jgi:hypothetical protein
MKPVWIAQHTGSNRVGFVIGLFYLMMETGSASEMLFASNREVEFNRLTRTEFVVTHLRLITEAELAKKKRIFN